MLNRLTREQTDCTKLIAHDECLSIRRELAIEWIVPYKAIDRVDTILAEVPDQLLQLDVPKDESASIATCHEQLLKDWMWGEHPRVLL